MNMQQMIMQAQKMQRELKKAKDAFYKQEFSAQRAGLVSVVMYGNKQVKEIEINKEALTEDNREMIQDLLTSLINELVERVETEEEKIESKITGQAGGLGF